METVSWSKHGTSAAAEWSLLFLDVRMRLGFTNGGSFPQLPRSIVSCYSTIRRCSAPSRCVSTTRSRGLFYNSENDGGLALLLSHAMMVDTGRSLIGYLRNSRWAFLNRMGAAHGMRRPVQYLLFNLVLTVPFPCPNHQLGFRSGQLHR